MSTRKTKILAVAAGLVIAGVSSAGTYVITKKRTLDEAYRDFDDRLAEEVQSTIDDIVARGLDLSKVVISNDLDQPLVQISDEDVKMAVVDEDSGLDITVPEVDPTDDSETEEERDIVPAAFTEKPSLDELAVRNQKTAYHKMIEESVYAGAVLDQEEKEADYVDDNITIIAKADFIENENEYGQMQLTYFSDGGVLDDMNEIVERPEDLIGAAVPPFGMLSDEDTVVYVRNDKRKEEYEVVKDDGKASDFLSTSLPPMEDAPIEADALQHSLEALRTRWNGPERT